MGRDGPATEGREGGMRDQAATPENGPLAGRAGGRGRSSVGREGTTERVNPEPGCGCCHDGRPLARRRRGNRSWSERASERASLIINGKLPQVCDLRACSAIDAAAAAVVPLRMGDERGDALLRFGILSPLLL